MRVAIDIRRAGDYGLGTYIRNVVNQLARIDNDSRYLLIGERRHLAEFDPLPGNFELLEYAHQPGTFRTHLHLPWLLRQSRVDILHMPWFYAPAIVPSRLLITVHDLSDVVAPQVGASPPVQTGRLFFARRALNRADHIFAVSHASKRDLARFFHIPESKITVVYDAVDERFLSEPPPADAERILERHAVNSPYVLYAGNIRPQKNLPRLIEAFAVAKAELRGHPELDQLKLLVIGEALNRHADLRRAVVRARVREDVRFLGFVPRPVLRVFYSRALAFLFPSLYEGFGLPPLEAMAHGTPVLTSNVSSLPEVFQDAALLVNPENVFDIARGIRQILTENALRQTLRRKGYERARMFSWEHAARLVHAAYHSVLVRTAAA
ncbi:MAG TPA: glycosyltransferase family 1 protein [Candidatus Acidoferrales bacterium]|jgi:glycosyltransferase involved in cell wall biosynthesis|nr:glycosyltransferase family 1 protein [Candidatus Acidoferrales bacterium]